ncbi:MAG: hypothetical protein FWC72_08050 [Oscillospiraceae bacterium]|nr:hypothetical protein [Oscillospiraceae bacterium]
MEKARAIETSVGVLSGRDCIFLDTVMQDADNNSMVFAGDINGNLVAKAKEWLPYKLKFMQVLAYFCCELDTYENLVNTNSNSSFDVMENSAWLESLPIRCDYDKNDYKHYRLFTYDDVYDIIAIEYQLEISS